MTDVFSSDIISSVRVGVNLDTARDAIMSALLTLRQRVDELENQGQLRPFLSVKVVFFGTHTHTYMLAFDRPGSNVLLEHETTPNILGYPVPTPHAQLHPSPEAAVDAILSEADPENGGIGVLAGLSIRNGRGVPPIFPRPARHANAALALRAALRLLHSNRAVTRVEVTADGGDAHAFVSLADPAKEFSWLRVATWHDMRPDEEDTVDSLFATPAQAGAYVFTELHLERTGQETEVEVVVNTTGATLFDERTMHAPPTARSAYEDEHGVALRASLPVVAESAAARRAAEAEFQRNFQPDAARTLSRWRDERHHRVQPMETRLQDACRDLAASIRAAPAYARLSEIADELEIPLHDDDVLPRLCGIVSRQMQGEGLAHSDLYERVVRGSRTQGVAPPEQTRKRRHS